MEKKDGEYKSTNTKKKDMTANEMVINKLQDQIQFQKK